MRITPIYCPLFSLLSNFLLFFSLSRFHANYPLFLALYFHTVQFLAVFFFLSRFHANYPYSLPSIFTTDTISCCFFSLTIPSELSPISCPLFSLLSQFLAVFSLSRFLANNPLFLAIYYHFCHNFLLFFLCHYSMRITPISCPLFSLLSQFLAGFFFFCIFVTIPSELSPISCPLFLLLSQFLAVLSLSRFLANYPYFLTSIYTTVTISCCFFLCHDSLRIIPYLLPSLSLSISHFPVFISMFFTTVITLPLHFLLCFVYSFWCEN